METRSKTRAKKNMHENMHENITYEFVFDFDDASEKWNENKRKTKNAHYQYICEYTLKTGNRCSKVACYETLMDFTKDRLCTLHNKKR